MKRPKLRARKAALVTPELCELFRKAIPYNQALWRDVVAIAALPQFISCAK